MELLDGRNAVANDAKSFWRTIKSSCVELVDLVLYLWGLTSVDPAV
jgi:hypothetical protein